MAVDALCNVARLNPDLLLNFGARYRRARHNRRLAEVLARADYRAGSPMETRIRMIIVGAGLPKPELQWVVQDQRARTAIWLDLAYPNLKIGIEYEGEVHTTAEGVLRDAGRYTRLVDQGWRIYRYTKYEVYNDPERIVAEITRALQHG